MNYKIYPVFLGSAMKPSGEDMYLYPAGETFELPYTCHVIKGGDEVILVDAGLPSQETIRKEKKPFMQMDNAPTFEEGLAKVGVKISDVTKIIITHLPVSYTHLKFRRWSTREMYTELSSIRKRAVM